MESDEGFRLVLFFQGFRLVLYHFFNGTHVLVDDRGSVLNHGFGDRSRGCFDHFSNGWSCFGSGLGSSGSCFSFLATTTHFTRVVRRTAVFGQGADWSCFNHRSGDFGNHWRFNHWLRLGNHGNGFRGDNHFSDWRWSFFDDWSRCWCFDCFNHCGWLGGPLERGLFFANFTHFRGWLGNRCFNNGFNHWLLFNNNLRLGNHFSYRLRLANFTNVTSRRYFHFHFRNSWRFDRSRCFNYRCFDDWRLYNGVFLDGGGGGFSLLVGLGFSRCADDRAGNSGGNGQAGSQFGASRFASSGSFAGLFRAFDFVAVGITLTLTTVAATTLTTGAAAWTIAFGVVLAIFLLLVFVGQQLFFFTGWSRLLGTWLALFTRRAWRTFFTGLTSWTLFSGGNGCSSSGYGRSGIQRLTQFTHAFFALATWLAVFTRGAWSARCTFSARSP